MIMISWLEWTKLEIGRREDWCTGNSDVSFKKYPKIFRENSNKEIELK